MAILANSTELTTDVRDLILETTASFWTDVFILRQLKKGHQILSTKLKLVSTIYTVTLQTAADPEAGYAQITDDREIRLPSSFISIDEGGVYYNDDVCSPTSIKQLKENKDWLDSTGTPRQYYLRGDMLGFDKQISADDTVRIYGIKMPAELAVGTAPFDGDYRTVGYRYLIVEYAVAMCWKKKNEMDKHDRILAPKVGSFWQGLKDMKFELLGNADDDYRLIKEENPAHSYKKKSWPDWEQFDT